MKGIAAFRYIIVVITVSLFSCQQTKKTEAHTEADKEVFEVSSTVDAAFSSDTLETLYAQYLGVKDALVRTDAAATQKAAETMVNSDKVSSAFPDIYTHAQKIAREEDVNLQREQFVELTRAVEAALEGDITSGKVFKQFCPMAFEGRGGYWLSNSEEIRNPYFGTVMLKCGEVKETLK